jgi:type IV pilus assembly protein PilX
MKMINRKQGGFVLVVSLIFLIIMTMLAITAIRRTTLDEKVSGNLRSQEIGFQAAERALRFCENALVLAQGARDICTPKSGFESWVIQPIDQPDTDNAMKNFPKKWQTLTNWSNAAYAHTLTGANQLTGVDQQPQCMIEVWQVLGDRTKYPYVITARGVGNVSTAVVWLQEVIRCGNK